MKNKHKQNTFLPSGCLAQDTMKRYLAGDLSLSAKAKADNHLLHCELCRDAMEGYGRVPGHQLFEQKVSEINQNVNSTFGKEKLGYQPRMTGVNKRFFYLTAAASVIILLGLYFILQYKLPTHSPLLTTAEHIDAGEEHIPPKPVAEEQTVDYSGNLPKPTLEKEEITPVDVAETRKETHATQKIVSPAQQTQPVKEQIRNIPESIIGSHDIREILIEDDQDESFAGEVSQSVDIASAGPVEYFLSGFTFFNEVPGYKRADDQEASDRYPAGTLTKAVSSKASGQTTAAAMDLPERLPAAEYIALEEEQVFDSAGIREHFFVLADQMPQFPGGEAALANYFQTSLRYPETARKAGVEGTVSVSFIIEENGQVSTVRVHYGPGHGIDEETIRVISEMPPWLPAIQDGISVRAVLTMPVTFRLR